MAPMSDNNLKVSDVLTSREKEARNGLTSKSEKRRKVYIIADCPYSWETNAA